MPPLPAHRVRHPAYFYPTAEATASRVSRLRDQRRRLAVRKERLSALETELVEAKREVDAACADARCGELRKRYGAETLRAAREAAKGAHSALARERKSLVTGVAEAERMVRAGGGREAFRGERESEWASRGVGWDGRAGVVVVVVGSLCRAFVRMQG